MGKISLQDQDILEKIILISKKISDAYFRLYEEEKNNNCETVNYSKLLRELAQIKKEEQQLYDELQLTPDKSNDLQDYIIKTEKSFTIKENNVLEAITNIDSRTLYIYRILNRLKNGFFKSNEEWIKYLLDNNVFFSKGDAKRYIAYRRFDESLENDFENAFVYFLNQDTIEEAEDEFLKSLCIKVKYDLSYISETVENRLMTDEYYDKDSLYFTFPFIAEFYKINKDNAEDLQFQASYNYCGEALKHLLIKDELVKECFGLEFTLYFIYMKAGLSLVYPLEDYDALIESLEEEICSINDSTNNKLSITTNALLEEMSYVGQSKDKCKYLHFVSKK